MPLRRADLIERYIKSQLNAVVGIGDAGSEKNRLLVEPLPIASSKGARARIEEDTSSEAEYSKQSAVFSRDIQIVEGAKQVITSGVRLQAFDDALVDW